MSTESFLGILVCIILSAFFSASEIAFASANKLRLKSKSEAGNKHAKLALEIADNFNEALSAILIGNNLVNIAASAIAAVIIIDLFGEKGTIISTFLMTIIILIFGEITPKTIAKKISDQYVLFSAYPLKVLMFLLQPVMKVVLYIVKIFDQLWEKSEEEPHFTEEEIVMIIESVEDEGIIDEEASDLLQSALEISDIHVSDILTPRTDLVTIDITDDMETIIDTVLDSPYSRIPVYEDSIDNIIGILYVNHFLRVLAEKKQVDKEELRAVLSEPVFVHKTMILPEAFSLLNNGKSQMAIVTDEYGGTMGCITIEEILEELVGEIWDEFDEIENDFIEVGENLYEVNGDVSIRDFADYLDIDEEALDSEYSTISGWLIEMFNGLPNVNDTLEYNNLIFKVLELGNLRIEKILVEVVETRETAKVIV
ncbi:MAG: HlyC/CorC family transporter [Firmicutes bacterium]|nr:HlyC/CorC family transporter [Bacillota bacterium]